MIRRKYFLLTILVTVALVGCQAQAQAKPTIQKAEGELDKLDAKVSPAIDEAVQQASDFAAKTWEKLK